MLAALAQVKGNSVPQTSLPWSVTSVATSVGAQEQLYEGVIWTLSETLLERLGGRIMGSLVVSVIPATVQGGSNPTRKGHLRGYAAVYRDGETIPITSTPDLPVELVVDPR